MNPLQASSIKIKKKNSRNLNPVEKSFLCGGCASAYRSYPALYLHIKRKHNGIRPDNTKTIKMLNPESKEKAQTHTGRPQKPSLDVDAVSESKVHIEQIQSDFLGFLGEELKIVSTLDSKPKLESIVERIIKVPNPSNDLWLSELKEKVVEFCNEIKKEETEIELDFDTFYELEKDDCLKILCWFLVWLGKTMVKLEALEDLTIIFSKIWTVIVQKELEIQDLDNKLVWNGVMKNCEQCLGSLVCFQKKKELVFEFICKVCHLIGKVFE